jgi:hypothetical protein
MRYLLACVVLAFGCGGETAVDAGAADVPLDAPPPPPWPHDLPAASELGDLRGFTHARTVVHLHSPLSHDACDGAGWVDGALADAQCLADLRLAACTLRMDALFLTDHVPHVEEVSFEAALWATEPGDDVVRSATGDAIAAHWACPDGRRVLVTVGAENDLMPVGLERHPVDPSDRMALAAAYDADGPDAAAVFRAAGALVFYAHTESKTLDQLRATAPDGFEIYNIHANVDPDIREDFLGLPAFGYLELLTRFSAGGTRLEPDLSFLAFYSENDNALHKWDTLLSEGMHLVGTGGCDAHQNTLPNLLPDGERGDSYRRMMRWHSHHLLVTGTDRASVMDALGRGRLYLAFEALGTPVGFDFHAARGGGTVAEMGDTAAVGDTLRVVMPSLPAGFPAEPAPTLTLRILRAAAGGAVEVTSGTGAMLEHVITEPGAYRAEVRMIPEHARPYLGRYADDMVTERVWVYANPIYVE